MNKGAAGLLNVLEVYDYCMAAKGIVASGGGGGGKGDSGDDDNNIVTKRNWLATLLSSWTDFSVKTMRLLKKFTEWMGSGLLKKITFEKLSKISSTTQVAKLLENMLCTAYQYFNGANPEKCLAHFKVDAKDLIMLGISIVIPCIAPANPVIGLVIDFLFGWI